MVRLHLARPLLPKPRKRASDRNSERLAAGVPCGNPSYLRSPLQPNLSSTCRPFASESRQRVVDFQIAVQQRSGRRQGSYAGG